MGITQDKIDSIIKNYVDANMPDEVEKYHRFLENKKKTQLLKYAKKIYVQDTLMWQDMKINEEKTMNIAHLRVYCRDLVLANRKDWRVPTYYELLELIDYSRTPSRVDGLNYGSNKNYWSISKDSTKKEQYWVVDFEKGITDTKNEDENHQIRCVRTLSQKRGEY